MGKLDGRVAIITGSTSGIGAAGAKRFASEGARVVVTGLSAERGAEIVREVTANGGEAVFIPADLRDTSQVRRLIADGVAHFGRLDVFWHNAGDAGSRRIDLVSEAEYEATMAIHLRAGFFGCQAAIPELLRSGGGSILLTGSGAALLPQAGDPTYSIAKAGLVMLAKCLAVHLGPQGIRVNCLCPGATDTKLRREVFRRRSSDQIDASELSAKNIAATPLGRVSDPDEIARVALFLVSDDASFVTGAVVSADGGLTAGSPSKWLRIELGD